MEITFVDKDEIVRYYDNGEAEILLPRFPSAIGRDVMKCHPPSVHDTVSQLIADLKAGKKDKQAAWFKRGDGVFVYIEYIALRDEAGEFLGILETVQDITELAEITGEHRDVNE